MISCCVLYDTVSKRSESRIILGSKSFCQNQPLNVCQLGNRIGVRSWITVIDLEKEGVKNGPKLVVSKTRSAPNFLKSNGILRNFLIEETPIIFFVLTAIEWKRGNSSVSSSRIMMTSYGSS